MSGLNPETLAQAKQLLSLYPHRRSALIPLCHLAQSQDGWLTRQAMCDIAELVGITPAEVLGTVSFYEMFHTEPIGRYLISVCTNISCMLGGAYDLLDHIKKRLKVSPDGTTSDGLFTLQEAECLAGCDKGPCVTVNHRYVDANTSDTFDALVEQLKAGSLEDAIPVHGVLIRVKRERGREDVKDDGVEVAT